ncbi:GGDEF domain-containing protein [Candidatus Pacearchaeota archaeon]|nr:GGDEF domain-containing protein [Candidatus Pacearchaeota archaeon]
MTYNSKLEQLKASQSVLERSALKEKINTSILQIGSDSLNWYLKAHPDIGTKLFPLKEGRAGERLKYMAIKTIAEKVEIFMVRNKYQLERFLENPESTEDVTALIKNVAYEIAEAVCYAMELESRINVDALTALPNRGAFEERLQEEISRAVRNDNPLCLLVVDLDKFKWINDKYGHRAGDEVLREVSRRLRSKKDGERILRDSDFVARYGGDELTLLLPSTTTEEGCIAAYRISQAISGEQCTVGKNGSSRSVDLSVSIGVSGFSGRIADPKGEKMFEEADDNLYILKGEMSDQEGVQKDRRGQIACKGRVLEASEIIRKLEENEDLQMPGDHRFIPERRRERILELVQ